MAGASGTTSVRPRRRAGRRRTATSRSTRISKACGTGAGNRLPLASPESHSLGRAFHLPSLARSLACYAFSFRFRELGPPRWGGNVRPGGHLGRSVLGMVPVQGAYLTGNAVSAECCSVHVSQCWAVYAPPILTHPLLPGARVYFRGCVGMRQPPA